MAMDSNGKSDPFCIIRVGDKKHKTSTKMKTLNPVWNETFTFAAADVEKADGVIQFELFDKDQWTKDDFLGHVSINVDKDVEGVDVAETFDLSLSIPATWGRFSTNKRNQQKDIGHVSVTIWWSQNQTSTNLSCPDSMMTFTKLPCKKEPGEKCFKVKKTCVTPSEDHPKSLPSIVHCSRGSVFEEPVAAVLILQISKVELTLDPCMPTNIRCATKCIFKTTGMAAKRHVSRVLGNLAQYRSTFNRKLFETSRKAEGGPPSLASSSSLSQADSFLDRLLEDASSDDEFETASNEDDSSDDAAPSISEIDVKKETRWFYEVKMFDQTRSSRPLGYVVNSRSKLDFDEHVMFVVQLPLPNIDVQISMCKKSDHRRSTLRLPFTVSLFDIMDADEGVIANTDNGSMLINYRLVCLDDRPRLMRIRHKLDLDDTRGSIPRSPSKQQDGEFSPSRTTMTKRTSSSVDVGNGYGHDPEIVIGGFDIFIDEIEIPNFRHGVYSCFCVLKCNHHWVMTSTIPTQDPLVWKWLLSLPIYDPATIVTLTCFGISNRHPQVHPGFYYCLFTGETSQGARIGKLRVRLSTLHPGKLYQCSLPFMSDGVQVGRAKINMKVKYPSEIDLVKSYVKSTFQKEIYDHRLAQGAAKSLIRKEQRNLIIQWLDTSEPRIAKTISRQVLDLEKESFNRKRFAMHIRRLQHCFAFMGPVGQKIRSLQMWENCCESLAFCLGIWLVGWNLLPCVVVGLCLLFWMISIRYTTEADPPSMEDPVLMPPGAVETAAQDRPENNSPEQHLNPYATLKSRFDQIQTTLVRIQKILDSIASFCERIHALLTWRDPVATRILTIGILAAMFLLSILGLRICICFGLCWSFRPPFLRTTLPPPPLNFFKRLPSKSDQIL